ncbi:DegT/DnrJ/EryC1/StrS family aminotransferase [Terrabacter sp. RAF57]|uniref:DegT/DnrJ/EryC1/StrS family aminotransferase n=1 Tax=Terrabacter sp. RAF57 TaxID=3233063 RepID=UPI003F984C00
MQLRPELDQPALVRFQRPSLPSLNEVAAYWAPAQESHWYSNNGPVLSRLTGAFEEYLGGDALAVPVNNATSALMIALRATCRPRPGSTVVMPSYTFAATGTAAIWAGFEPRFVDVNLDHWHADAAAVADAVEREKPVALLLCSTYGITPPKAVVEQWESIAAAANIPLIVDSAAGFGSRDVDGMFRPVGNCEIFSFHATKPFAIGEGGLVVTREPRLASSLRRLTNFGFDEDRILRREIGMNAKMDELHAAVALAVMDNYESILARRRGYAATLVEKFATAGLSPQVGMEGAAHQFLPLMCTSGEQRIKLLTAAKVKNIELRTYFSEPLHTMPGFAEFRREAGTLAATEVLASRIVCLPLYNNMDDETIERISDLAEVVNSA